MTESTQQQGATQPQPGSIASLASTSTLAVVSLILAILGWIALPFIGGLAGVITGHMAKKEIRNSNGKIGGSGLATAGLWIGYPAMIVFPCLLFSIGGLTFFGNDIQKMFGASANVLAPSHNEPVTEVLPRKTGYYVLNLSPPSLKDVTIHLNETNGTFIGVYPPGRLELVEGLHRLVLSGPQLIKPAEIQADVKAGQTVRGKPYDLSQLMGEAKGEEKDEGKGQDGEAQRR